MVHKRTNTHPYFNVEIHSLGHESESVSCSVKSDPFATPLAVRLLCLFNSPGKTARVGSHSLLQGIFLTQGSTPGLPHCRQSLYHLSHQGSPIPLVMGLNKHILVLASSPHFSLLLLLHLLLLLPLLVLALRWISPSCPCTPYP